MRFYRRIFQILGDTILVFQDFLRVGGVYKVRADEFTLFLAIFGYFSVFRALWYILVKYPSLLGAMVTTATRLQVPTKMAVFYAHVVPYFYSWQHR